MFNSTNSNSSHEERLPDDFLKKLQFIIVYGKNFKKPSLRLYNIVASKYTCVLWNEKVYHKNEPRLTNKNKRIFIGGDHIFEYDENGEFDENNFFIQITSRVAFVTQGPMASLCPRWDDDMDDEFPHAPKWWVEEYDDNKLPWWKKYNPLYSVYNLLRFEYDALVTPGKLAGYIMPYFILAVDKAVKEGYIDKFINNELV